MKILLQFPEGLKEKALTYAKEEEAKGNEVYVSASPSFGACDLALDEAKMIGAEKLVHFGHAEFHHVDFNVEYREFAVDADLDILEESVDALKDYNKIGIVTTIQHIHQLQYVKEFYEKNGKTVVIGKPYGFAKKPGQILGCDIGSAARIDNEVDAFVYFGGGMFHPLGALLNTKKPFLVVEPFTRKVEFIDQYREIYRKRKNGKIARALSARSFGIVVSTKNGQHNMNLAGLLKSRIEAKGLRAAILTANTINFESLDNMREFDAFVNTACPRISIDDITRTRKPMLSANELNEVLEMLSIQTLSK
jgi:2-(3-amino-3-carboxypropyl)histidine synthase